MRKIKFLGLLVAFTFLVSGCGCSKIDEETYASAVETFKNTDAIEFTRAETISKAGEDTYTKKKVDAKLIYDANKKVTKMEYHFVKSISSINGGDSPSEVKEYYYNSPTFYTYSKVGQYQQEAFKQTINSYESKFNVNVCEDSDCMLMITYNIAPIFGLDEVDDFSISDEGVATFKGVCPGFENCSSNSEVIDYTVEIDDNANIKMISYSIVNGDTTYSVIYSFANFGTNNVNIEFPSNLDTYIEKNS